MGYLSPWVCSGKAAPRRHSRCHRSGLRKAVWCRALAREGSGTPAEQLGLHSVALALRWPSLPRETAASTLIPCPQVQPLRHVSREAERLAAIRPHTHRVIWPPDTWLTNPGVVLSVSAAVGATEVVVPALRYATAGPEWSSGLGWRDGFATERTQRLPPLPGRKQARTKKWFVNRPIEVEVSAADGSPVARAKLSGADRLDGANVAVTLAEGHAPSAEWPAGTRLRPINGDTVSSRESWRVSIYSFGAKPPARQQDAPVPLQSVLLVRGSPPDPPGDTAAGAHADVECVGPLSTLRFHVTASRAADAYKPPGQAPLTGLSVEVWTLGLPPSTASTASASTASTASAASAASTTASVASFEQTVSLPGVTNPSSADGSYRVQPSGQMGRMTLAASEAGLADVAISRMANAVSLVGKDRVPAVSTDWRRALVVGAGVLKKGSALLVCSSQADPAAQETAQVQIRPTAAPSLALSLYGRPGRQRLELSEYLPGGELAGFIGRPAADYQDGNTLRDSMYSFHFTEGPVKESDYAALLSGGEERNSEDHIMVTDSLGYDPLSEVGLTGGQDLLERHDACSIRQTADVSGLRSALEAAAVRAAVPVRRTGLVLARETRKTHLANWPAPLRARVWRVRFSDGTERSYLEPSDAQSADAANLPLHLGMQGVQRMLPWLGLGSLALTSAMASPLPRAPHVCHFVALTVVPDVRAPLDRFFAAHKQLELLLPLLLNPMDLVDTQQTFVSEVLPLLSHSSAAIKVMEARRSSDLCEAFTELPVFGPRVEMEHDVFHAVLNGGIRVIDKGSVCAFVMGPAFQDAWKRRLLSQYVPSGAQKTKAGGFRLGKHPMVVYQCRGHQSTGAFLAQWWRCFSDAATPATTLLAGALERAFESIAVNMNFIRWALHYMRSRAQTFFMGSESMHNQRVIEDMLDAAWLSIRQRLCALFPGECDAAFNAAFATDAWMMRSFHTVGHGIREQFKRGWHAQDATTTEDLQTDSREAFIDGHSVHARTFESLELLQNLELKRREELRVRGGYAALAAEAAKDLKCGRRGHRGQGQYFFALTQCIQKRDAHELAHPDAASHILITFTPRTPESRWPFGTFECPDVPVAGRQPSVLSPDIRRLWVDKSRTFFAATAASQQQPCALSTDPNADCLTEEEWCTGGACDRAEDGQCHDYDGDGNADDGAETPVDDFASIDYVEGECGELGGEDEQEHDTHQRKGPPCLGQ